MLLDGTTAMSSVVTALQSILTTDAMFTNLAALIPVVGGVLIFASFRVFFFFFVNFNYFFW